MNGVLIGKCSSNFSVTNKVIILYKTLSHPNPNTLALLALLCIAVNGVVQ